ncbi:cob(I)yrinic acid a,c-diamide adenosyltransferase [Sulfobacillus harzensis]|uniref:Corrinoid adenosyltransferase n=1 Tax=Sulfobacillus harzensis TaxID=2729629 RepID=A0A7Y0L860_9FIRM|nr:cob(I)yrinic acid a,c-diamide adenosyltransferase [Sulfobacillus harzensis]NMP23679.1 cob(I)yrinic acid a,c-diamide adenosyltransferase [Sulfobacillus harzensis]
MPIYTRRGDQGKTQVIGSPRRFKDDARVQAYGAVDEAGAIIGVAVSFLGTDEKFKDIHEILSAVQQTLWDVGADLARVDDAQHPYRTTAQNVQHLERIIDDMQEQYRPLERFILRGGAPVAALLHWACTVVRRAERDVVHLQQIEGIHPTAVQYLNRLSDLLFVLARVVNARSGQAEIEYVRSARVFHG